MVSVAAITRDWAAITANCTAETGSVAAIMGDSGEETISSGMERRESVEETVAWAESATDLGKPGRLY